MVAPEVEIKSVDNALLPTKENEIEEHKVLYNVLTIVPLAYCFPVSIVILSNLPIDSFRGVNGYLFYSSILLLVAGVCSLVATVFSCLVSKDKPKMQYFQYRWAWMTWSLILIELCSSFCFFLIYSFAGGLKQQVHFVVWLSFVPFFLVPATAIVLILSFLVSCLCCYQER